MKKITCTMIVLVFLLSSFAFAFDSEDNGFGEGSFDGIAEEERLTGKDFVEIGTLGIFNGTLKYMDDEWFAKTEDMLYEIHLGDHDYRAENIRFDLEEGQEVVVVGYIYEDEVAVVLISLAKYTYQCRTTDGMPLWAASAGFGTRGQLSLEQRLEIGGRNMRTDMVPDHKEEGVEECE